MGMGVGIYQRGEQQSWYNMWFAIGLEMQGLHLDHDISLEIVLKAFELKLQHRREIIKQHSLASILQKVTHKLCKFACILFMKKHTPAQESTIQGIYNDNPTRRFERFEHDDVLHLEKLVVSGHKIK